MRNFNITDIRSLSAGEIISLSAEGKNLKVQNTERKRKYYYLTFKEEGQKKTIRRKFSFEKAVKMPVYLKTDLQKTQVPFSCILKLAMI